MGGERERERERERRWYNDSNLIGVREDAKGNSLDIIK